MYSQMTRFRYDCWKTKVLSRRRKVDSDGTETSSGSAFHIRGAETLKDRLPTVDSLDEGTTRRLVLAERSDRRPAGCHSLDGAVYAA